MHITFVIDSLGGGGAERVVLRLAKGLIDRGHKVDIAMFQAIVHYPKDIPEDTRLFVMNGGFDKGKEQSAKTVLTRLVRIPRTLRPFDWARAASALNWNPCCLPTSRMVGQARAIASYIALEKPDCILPNLPGPKIATLLAYHFLTEFPPIIPVVHNVVRYRRRRRRRAQYLFANAAHCVGVSHGVSKSLADTIGVPAENITTIYNPVVTPDLTNMAMEQPNHPWFLDHGAPIILAAGRLEKQKDYPTLIRAFSRLAGLRPCRLVILGHGSKQHELEALAKDLAVADRVSFAGWTDNPFAFMSRAALFVLSSIHEGFSLVLAEALACGCPCVSTDCPSGPAEILQHGRLGPLVPVGDDAALAEAMGHVLDQPPDGNVLRQRAIDFSAERSVDTYEQLIESLIISPTVKTSDDARLA